MNINISTVKTVQTLEKLLSELSRSEQAMPTPHLREEIARLASSIKGCTARIASSEKQALEQLQAKKEKNHNLAAKNKAAIKHAQLKLQQKSQAIDPSAQIIPSIDPHLGSLLRDELLDRFADLVPQASSTMQGKDILADWEWD